MAIRRRHASLEAVLIYVDGPQLVSLLSGKTRFLAAAIRSDNQDSDDFLVVSVSQLNWQKYTDGRVNLLYLFNFAKPRSVYTMSTGSMKGGKFILTPLEGKIPEDWLPGPKVFSRHHTEPFDQESRSGESFVLHVDGEWEMPEFGRFQSQYADLYSFSCVVSDWKDPGLDGQHKQRIRRAFEGKPFKGGSSYVSFFDDVESILPANDRLKLDSISYASPGQVKVSGRAASFEETETVIFRFLGNEADLQAMYGNLHRFLSTHDFLKMSGRNYVPGTYDQKILRDSKTLYDALGLKDFEALMQLSKDNSLVAAKICLALYRRIKTAATFFAEGRMSF